MAVGQPVPIARHPYADGSYKKMLIDGKWQDAASGKRFETHNPATGELLATVAEGDAEDINRAVAAARRAFEGPWSKVNPFERQALLLNLAGLVEKNLAVPSQLATRDLGAPSRRTPGTKLRVHRQTISRVIDPLEAEQDVIEEPAVPAVNESHAIPAGEPQYGERVDDKPKRAPRKKAGE